MSSERPPTSLGNATNGFYHADHTDFTNHTNYTDDYLRYEQIMAMYRYRSIPYTLLAIFAGIFNVMSLMAILKMRRPRTVYHSLLANLAAGDIVGSLLVWLYHNSVLLYPDFDNEGDATSLKICLLKSAGLLVPILLAMTNSTLALIMLSFNQFLAICHPFFAQTRLAPEKAHLVILAAWVLSVCSSSVPVVVVLVQAYLEDCSVEIQSKMITSLEVCAYLLASLILVIIFLYARVYREVLKCRKRSMELSMTSRKPAPPNQSLVDDMPTSGDRREDQVKVSAIRGFGSNSTQEAKNSLPAGRSRLQQHQNQPLLTGGASSALNGRHHGLGSPETNFKAFVTTLLMTGTLLLFWLPYLLVSSLSIYSSDSELSDYPDLLVNVKFYFIDFLPLLNYISDPIVYGVRIRCVRLSFGRLYGSLCSRWRDRTRRETGRSLKLTTQTTNAANGRFASGGPTTIIQEFSFCN